MKRFIVSIPGCATHTDATLLDVARWALGSGQRPTPQQFDRLSRIKVGGTISNAKQGWHVTRKFVPESDHADRMQAANRASFLNGQGALVASKEIIDSLRGCIRALQGLYPWPIAGKWTQKEAREAARQAAEGALRKAGL